MSPASWRSASDNVWWGRTVKGPGRWGGAWIIQEMLRYAYPTQRHFSLKCYSLSLAKVKPESRHSLGSLIVGDTECAGGSWEPLGHRARKRAQGTHPSGPGSSRWLSDCLLYTCTPCGPPPACLVGLICPQSHCILPKSRTEGRMVTADLHERWDPEQPSLAQPVHRGQTPLCSARLASSHDVKTRG